jgi:SAM-dependent methyltransferase
MKRALLVHAQQRFSEMKAGHEQPRSTGATPRLAAPISPTPDLIVDAFLPLLELDATSFLVDLGCGDGRWLLAAAARARCRCLGLDVAPARLRAAREALARHGLGDRATVRRGDLFAFAREDPALLRADAVVLYLFREAAAEVGAALRRRLTGGARRVRIVSVGFALPGWTPVREALLGGLRVYLYATHAGAGAEGGKEEGGPGSTSTV